MIVSSLASIPVQSYSDPWCLSLGERLRLLWRGERRIAYFYDRANNSTFRYRVYNMVQVLNAGPSDVSASYFFLEDAHRFSEIADAADILVICRTGYDNSVHRLITAFHNRGKKVLFDVDDLVFNSDYIQLILEVLDQDINHPQAWDYWFAYTGRLGATLKQCDGAITTNEFLAEQIRGFADVPVAIVPNFMNREQLEYSNRLYAAKALSKPGEDGLIHFGYFSGTPSHNKDFALVIPALEALLEDRKDVGLVVVGYIDPGPVLERFGTRVKKYPFHDFVNLQRLIATVEFNLMPLQYNTFANCKSELKYFEAAIVGSLSIASPSFNYSRAITDGKTGYLAKAFAWESVMRTALAQLDTYQEMAECAYQDAREKYAWSNQVERILSALSISA